MKESFLKELSNNLYEVLNENLISLLLIGSVLKTDETPFSDLDLIMVLNNTSIETLMQVRSLIKDKTHLVDLVIMSLDEIPKNPADFQMGTHGCYFIEVLRSARLLRGSNIFIKYGSPSAEAIKTSIFKKLAEYNWYARRMFVEANRERSVYQNYQLSSRLIKAVKDMLRIYNYEVSSLCAKETITLLLNNFEQDFSTQEKKILFQIVNPEITNQLAANMTEGFLVSRIGIMEILFKKSVAIIR